MPSLADSDNLTSIAPMSCIRRLTSRRRWLAAMRGLGRAATESARQVPRWVVGASACVVELPLPQSAHDAGRSAVGTSPPNCQISTSRLLTFGSRGSPRTHPEGAARVVSQCKIMTLSAGRPKIHGVHFCAHAEQDIPQPS